MMRDIVVGGIFLVVPVGLTAFWELSARVRLAEMDVVDKSEPAVAVAEASDVEYCTANLKKILRRVLQSCGLVAAGETRGCQPLDAKKVATMSGEDFNALFLPLAKRAGIIEFDQSSAELDVDDNRLLDRIFANQQGASYFFVVARASPEGSEVYNRDLSQARGESVLQHLQATFQDPDLDKEVGLLWLGEEFAQLDEQFCTWQRSGAAECNPQDLNRSAFVAWIDCQL
jgi:outer membrane protein OmpA-like peptidoglycan-associated protein